MKTENFYKSMEEQYQSPSVTVIEFDELDVVTASVDDGSNWGEWDPAIK